MGIYEMAKGGVRYIVGGAEKATDFVNDLVERASINTAKDRETLVGRVRGLAHDYRGAITQLGINVPLAVAPWIAVFNPDISESFSNIPLGWYGALLVEASALGDLLLAHVKFKYGGEFLENPVIQARPELQIADPRRYSSFFAFFVKDIVSTRGGRTLVRDSSPSK